MWTLPVYGLDLWFVVKSLLFSSIYCINLNACLPSLCTLDFILNHAERVHALGQIIQEKRQICAYFRSIHLAHKAMGLGATLAGNAMPLLTAVNLHLVSNKQKICILKQIITLHQKY